MRDIHKIVEHNGYNINIIRDSDPQSPRDWGSLGTMYTMHRRYQPEKSFSDHFEWEEVFDRNRDLLSSFEERYIALKFYLYDHGGQSVSTTPFSCGWDSGLFGIIAVEVDKVKEEYGWKRITKERREKVEGYLGGEVELYNQYLTGEVYGYTMTERQIEAAKNALPKWDNGNAPKLTPKQQRLSSELDCRSMINSCLIYGTPYDFYNEQTNKFGHYSQRYRETLGDDAALKLFNEQQADFAKATVLRNVYTDHEGCSYNSCKWGDE